MHFLAIIIPTMEQGDGTIALLFILNIAVNIPIDIFSSWGMYRIAKRRMLPCPWLAWIPLGNLWTLGCIADRYRQETYDRRSFSRWTLLGLSIFLGLFFLDWLGVDVFSGVMNALIENCELLLSLYLLISLITIWCSLYRLYDSCRSNLSGLFTVLSVLLSIPTPLCIMLCSKWDDDFPAE